MPEFQNSSVKGKKKVVPEARLIHYYNPMNISKTNNFFSNFFFKGLEV